MESIPQVHELFVQAGVEGDPRRLALLLRFALNLAWIVDPAEALR